MSDQRRIVPRETPRAWAACEVERPRGLLLRGSMSANFTRFGKVHQGRATFAQPRAAKALAEPLGATMWSADCRIYAA
jgi:hypothetical protein